jgi:flavin reductase (DIM6/NTAB) family NADH-FMN oxidoreductase RutF
MDHAAPTDPVERVYNRRERGLGVVMVSTAGGVHAHVGCWFMLAAGTPWRLVVSVPHDYPAGAMMRDGGRFTLSLPGRHQVGAVAELYRGHRSGQGFPPGFFAAVPSGQLCLNGALAVFDCRVEELRDLGDADLVTGVIEHAGIDGPGVNLTAREFARTGGVDPIILPVEPWARPPRPLPVVPMGRRGDQAYARRRWGLMAVMSGTPHDWAGAITSGLIQVSHAPARFLMLVPPGSALDRLVERHGTWSAAIVTPSVLSLAGKTRLEAAEALVFQEEGPVVPGALGHFAGTVVDRWTIGSRIAVLGTVDRYQEGPPATTATPDHPTDGSDGVPQETNVTMDVIGHSA